MTFSVSFRWFYANFSMNSGIAADLKVLVLKKNLIFFYELIGLGWT